MGWLFNEKWGTRDDLVLHLVRELRACEGLELLQSRRVGNNHWYVARALKTGEVFIGLDLLKSGGKSGWGYKSLDESWGPGATDCPLSFLKLATEPKNEKARQWRQAVTKRNALDSSLPEPAPGLVIEVGGEKYRLLRRMTQPRKGWQAEGVKGGVVYQIPCAMVKKALRRAAERSAAAPADAAVLRLPEQTSQLLIPGWADGFATELTAAPMMEARS